MRECAGPDRRTRRDRCLTGRRHFSGTGRWTDDAKETPRLYAQGERCHRRYRPDLWAPCGPIRALGGPSLRRHASTDALLLGPPPPSSRDHLDAQISRPALLRHLYQGHEHTGAEDGRRAAAAQRRQRSARHRSDVRDSARGVSLQPSAPPRLREPCPRHRLRPDDLPAARRGAHDPGARTETGGPCARGRHRIGLSGRGSEPSRAAGDHSRARAIACGARV